ncbi:hypothetical protein KKC22_17445, partial [Myxococcota bacterium]|nr:hypothetical protein [Myxococcota bacterium]
MEKRNTTHSSLRQTMGVSADRWTGRGDSAGSGLPVAVPAAPLPRRAGVPLTRGLREMLSR